MSGVVEISRGLVKLSGVVEISRGLVKMSGVVEISRGLVKMSGVLRRNRCLITSRSPTHPTARFLTAELPLFLELERQSHQFVIL